MRRRPSMLQGNRWRDLVVVTVFTQPSPRPFGAGAFSCDVGQDGSDVDPQ